MQPVYSILYSLAEGRKGLNRGQGEGQSENGLGGAAGLAPAGGPRVRLAPAAATEHGEGAAHGHAARYARGAFP